ncbi:hypothetical protein SMICM304S_01620 [Streptomyces microflavus]
MGAHAVRERLDQGRALAAAGALQGGAGHGQTGEYVVAVDPDAGEAVTLRALVERHAGLALGGLGDGPLVVLAEEHDRGVVDRGEGERLGHVALAGGAVTEVRDHGRVRAVLGDAHGVAVACRVCEPMTIVYRWKLLVVGSQPPWFTPRNMPSRLVGSTPRHQATPCSR